MPPKKKKPAASRSLKSAAAAPKKKAAAIKKAVPARKEATKDSAKKTIHAEKPKKGTVKAPKPSVAASKQAQAQPTEPAGASKMRGIRIRLSAFDHTVLDESSLKIVDTAVRTGAVVHGPIPLPTKIKKFTVNRSTFVHKDARDQFEMRTHRRLIDLSETTFKTVDALQNLSLPSGVGIEIRMG